ncbi:hypothetical protein SLEP1_g5811 [Rubroshorea leprosula]|uniref:Uncharacterized protein n=1 Tax=Rubroshorea leprosula TaxID=152421 RepID=A0AAV5HTG4_9ROSI|nr:hypothetical protein SLEP1_g5811 [Rubroshorea leprosula]
MANCSRFFILLLMITAIFNRPRSIQSRQTLHLNQQGYSSFANLGIVCKCCDGAGGECRTTMDIASCPKPKRQCHSWKFH